MKPCCFQLVVTRKAVNIIPQAALMEVYVNHPYGCCVDIHAFNPSKWFEHFPFCPRLAIGKTVISLQWRHNGLEGVSNHQSHHCLLDRLLRRRIKKTSKFRVTGICAGNSPVTGEFPAQMASKAKLFPFDDVIMMSRDDTCARRWGITW